MITGFEIIGRFKKNVRLLGIGAPQTNNRMKEVSLEAHFSIGLVGWSDIVVLKVRSEDKNTIERDVESFGTPVEQCDSSDKTTGRTNAFQRRTWLSVRGS
jgi:hypothetical protein